MTTQSPNMWCPSCGTEYRAGSLYCSTCRVALVREPVDATSASPGEDDDGPTDLVEMGQFPRLHAQILRRRLESANIPVLVEWSDTGTDAVGTLLVPTEHGDFAYAVINEVDVDDEVPDTSPIAYVARIEEHLAAAEALLEELRTRLEDQGF
jgi:hypothetical protein